MTALSRLARLKGRDRPSILLTTVNAALQRVPPRKDFVASACRSSVGARQRARHGRHRRNGSSSTASSAPRRCASPATTRCAAASSISIRPAWTSRCGSTSSATRWRRSAASIPRPSARPTSCARSISCRSPSSSSPPRPSGGSAPAMSPRSARRRATTSSTTRSAKGRRHPGMEHWLPLFHDRLDTLFDYVPGSPVVLEPLAEDAARERLGPDRRLLRGARSRRWHRRMPARSIGRCRPTGSISATAEWDERLEQAQVARLTPFAVPDGQGPIDRRRHAAGAQFRGRARRARQERVRGRDARMSRRCRQPASASIVALWSEGARERHEPRARRPRARQPVTGRLLAGGAGAAEAASRARRCSGSKAASRPPTPRSSASRTSSATGWCGRAAARQARRQLHRRSHGACRPAISSCMSITASAVSSACARSRRRARRTIAWRSTTPAATSSSCRSRTSNCCRATAPRRATSISTGSAAAAGRRARRGCASASSRSPTS